MGRTITPLKIPGITILRMRRVRTRPTHTTRIRCLCLCRCGRKFFAWKSSLKEGNTRSCGCLRSKANKQPSKRLRAHPREKVYRAWQGMRARCNNKNNLQYKDWGGRGIRVCERWSSFEVFLRDVGYPPSSQHTLDRIDNDGHYEPGNVRWATRAQQSRNRRKPQKQVFATEEELLSFYDL